MTMYVLCNRTLSYPTLYVLFFTCLVSHKVFNGFQFEVPGCQVQGCVTSVCVCGGGVVVCEGV